MILQNSIPIQRQWNEFIIKRIHRNVSNLKFVPQHSPVKKEEIYQLQKFINETKTILVLTGAGASTESGIPDYRSEGVGLYSRTSNRPIQHADFVQKESARKRYWARNIVGWNYFSKLQPNNTHITLKQWEISGRKLLGIVTQNVDGLHQKAGSQNVVELHGTAYRVKCLDCGNTVTREEFQKTLLLLNPTSFVNPTAIRPDGDVDLPLEHIMNFIVPPCSKCQGIMKPDIVFFGDNVPKPKVQLVYDILRKADALLVLGSSLQVFSAYRFALAASEQKKKIAIVNIGQTRGDHLAHLKIDVRCGELIPLIVV